jgi:PHD/YefM family antitoxin component YafN of YafNO toxin-antitoxin module
MNATVQYLTDEKGKKTAVVMPIEDYEKLREDMDDLAVIAERRDEETIPHADFKRGLRRNGVSN